MPIIVSGESLTPTKRQQMEAAGVLVTTKYIISDIGRVGCGCPQAGASDDIHVFSDFMAVIQRRRKVANTDSSVDAFLLTPLLPTATRILLNAESDDYGVIETRNCDCLFGQLGFNTHIHSIRSFVKLTAGIWGQANMLRVKRMHPISKMGKVATLHLMKK